MRIVSPQYMEGWSDLANDVQRFVSRTIDQHNGATSAVDMLGVVNDLIRYSHALNHILYEYQEFVEQQREENSESGERLLYLVSHHTREATK